MRVSKLFMVGLILLPLIVATSSAIASQTTPLVEMAARWPFISLAIAMLLAGLFLSRIFQMWQDLSLVERVGRCAGVAIAAFGIFALMLAITDAPPTKSGALPWLSDYDEALVLASQSGHPVMVDFTADWCTACHELEAKVFHHPRVQNRLVDELHIVKIDFEDRSDQTARLAREFSVAGLPTVVFVDPDGTYLEAPSFEGLIDVDEFLLRIDAARTGAGLEGRGDLQRMLGDRGLLVAILLIFLAGLLSSLTPCVYPLIPITIGLFGARQTESRTEGFFLSLVYVLGIVLTYSVLGVLAASLGHVFGAALQSPYVLGGISLLFILLGLSSLGLFEFRVPAAVGKVGSTKKGGFLGAFLMGLVAGIIAAPCVGPIVAGILVYVAAQQDLFLGGLLLAVFAFGMGQLFIVLGTFSSLLSRIPRSGPWMSGIKVFFGMIFIGMALFYLRFLLTPLSDLAREIWRLAG